MYLTVVPVVRLVLVLAVALVSAGADTYDCIHWGYFQQQSLNGAANLYAALKMCYDSESNVRHAINAALNTAIPHTFRRVPGDRLGV